MSFEAFVQRIMSLNEFLSAKQLNPKKNNPKTFSGIKCWHANGHC